ncbi:MAG: Fe-S cluster assembly protein SufD [Acidobacteria bacterium]|nr:Fe-S cluster assembly protein SufD [Acidobacteriota bacterium]MCW5948522.1 Fe-S cluster assembly protein SufD [Pyrinomonadaceae bacterium]
MMNTKAVLDPYFAESFRATLSGANSELDALRESAFRTFESLGLPSPRNEEWKYTDISSIFRSEWRMLKPAATEIGVDAMSILKRFKADRNGLAALNLAFADIKVMTIPADTRLAEPIEIDLSAAEDEMSAPHVIVIAEPGSSSTIVETYRSSGRGLTNSAMQIVVGDNASVTHYRVQNDDTAAFSYGITEATLGRDSRYDATSIELGCSISRHDIDVRFTAEGGEAWVDGLYMLSGSQHHDTHSCIDHAVPNCISHQRYKGVLDGRSRGVFNGKVFVRENAHGTDAQQQNKNLLLSNEARVDTKPQLEIFNDDVKCSHGATVGQLEDEELFYLLTRGLPEPLARNLLTYGFAEEIINKIGVGSIKGELDAMVLNRLGTAI